MKHLTTYKIFESTDNLKSEVLDIYQDFIDAFNLTQDDNYKDWYTNKRIAFSITSKVRFGEGVKVVIQNSDVNGGRLIKNGPSKGFDGLPSDVAVELEKAHNRCLQHITFKESHVGSYYNHQSGGLTITYYTNPSFEFEGKKFNPEYLSSEGVYVRKLPILKGYVMCKGGHSNIFDFFTDNENISGMFALWGGSPMNYYNPIAIMSGRDCDKYGRCIANSPIEQWVTKQWSDMCQRYDILVSKMDWNMSRKQRDGDPTVYEFMDYLVDHQDDFKNYKELPKVNKDRHRIIFNPDPYKI